MGHVPVDSHMVSAADGKDQVPYNYKFCKPRVQWGLREGPRVLGVDRGRGRGKIALFRYLKLITFCLVK